MLDSSDTGVWLPSALAGQFERRRCGAGAELRIEAVEPVVERLEVWAISDLLQGIDQVVLRHVSAALNVRFLRAVVELFLGQVVQLRAEAPQALHYTRVP